VNSALQGLKFCFLTSYLWHYGVSFNKLLANSSVGLLYWKWLLLILKEPHFSPFSFLIAQSVQLRVGRLGFLSGRVNIFLYSTPYRLTLEPFQPPTQWVLGSVSPGVKLTTHLHLVSRWRTMELYLHSLICLHGIVLNKLSTRITLPFIIFLVNLTIV
jgi:hypothetical protein